MENLNSRRPKTRLKSTRSPRSFSPNNVVINGTVIDKKASESLVFGLKMPLDNILEESDFLLQDLDNQLTESTSVPLENAVKRADENVRKFIEEISSHTNLQGHSNAFQSICNDSQEELKGLSNFLSTIDDNSKDKIVGTLINVYKTEILTGVKRSALCASNSEEPQDKISKFKNMCKGLINEYQNKVVMEPMNLVHQKSSKAVEKYELNFPCSGQLENQVDSGENTAGNGTPTNQIGEDIGKELQKNEEENEQVSNDESEATNLKVADDVEHEKYMKLETDITVNFNMDKSMIDTLNKSRDRSLENIQQPSTCYEQYEPFSKFENPFNSDIFKNGSKSTKAPETSNYHNQARCVKKTSADIPIAMRFSKEQAINRLLGRECKDPISGMKYTVKTYHKDISETHPLQKENKHIEAVDVKHFISEGIQASLIPLRKNRKAKNNIKYITMDYVKPYRYRHPYFTESQSDIAINCPFGCQLRLKKSLSVTDFHEYDINKERKYRNQRKQKRLSKKDSLIAMERKSSLQLIKAKDIRRKNQLITYLDNTLKRGDSEFQFSQVLFETNKNIENDVSSVEIPALEQKQVDNFNANYLLHALRIQRDKKTDIWTKVPLHSSFSDMTITEEDYKLWLKKRNWSKYSNIFHEMKSLDELRSVSQTFPNVHKKEKRGEYEYYFDKENHVPKSLPSEQTSTLISEISENFLYEHVVISRALNFFSSFNAKRTKTLSFRDRCFQVLFFALFYMVWIFFSKYVFVEPTRRKGSILWR